VETDGPDNASGRDEPDGGATILRFPKDWFGPTEELVPFGPRVDGECVGGDWADTKAAPLDESPTPASAAAFWSADSEKIHDAVQGPVSAEAVGRPRVAARRVLVAAFCGLLGLGLLGRFAFQGGSHAARRPAAVAHVHVWTAVSHPDAVRPRRKPVAKAPRHRSVAAPAASQNVSAQAPLSPPASAATQAQVDSAASSTASSSSGGGASDTGASAASDGPSSQPAFGANGALGPGSSPNS
jgi:hypothetical protein